MATRRSYADALAASGLPPPEHAMLRTYRVFGVDWVPTRPRGLQQHQPGVYTHRLQWQVGLGGDTVSGLLAEVLNHIQRHGCTVVKPAVYLTLLQNLCFAFAQARVDSLAYGVPVVVTFSKHRSPYSRGPGTAESLPGYAIVTRLFDALVELGLVVVTTSKVDGRLSTIVPTAAFLPFDADLTPVILSHNGQACVMSARTKQKGEKEPTGKLTKTGRPQMKSPVVKGGHERVARAELNRLQQRLLERECRKLTVVNSLASRCRLAYCAADDVWRPYFAGHLLLHAVWNDGDTDCGGRNYCGAQNLPQRCRVPIRETLHLALDGQSLRALVEVDYKNLHIRMLYARVGHALRDDFDCYDVEIPGWPRCPAQRDFLKVLLLALPNCGSAHATAEQNLTTARAMAHRQYRDWRDEAVADDLGGDLTLARRRERALPIGITAAHVLDAVLAAHKPIEQYLFTGEGLRLQAVDGQIARNILLHFARKGVPVVCVHDSFMIWPEYADELTRLMVSEYRAEMTDAFGDEYDGSAPVPERKRKKRRNLPPIPAELSSSQVVSVQLPAVAAIAAVLADSPVPLITAVEPATQTDPRHQNLRPGQARLPRTALADWLARRAARKSAGPQVRRPWDRPRGGDTGEEQARTTYYAK